MTMKSKLCVNSSFLYIKFFVKTFFIIIFILIIGFLVVTNFSGYKIKKICIGKKIFQNRYFAFMDDPLAMKISDYPISQLRTILSEELGFSNYKWIYSSGKGALVKVFREEELSKLLPNKSRGRSGISLSEIHEIAELNNIQDTKFNISGIGSHFTKGETNFFLIIRAPNLLKIRKLVYERFLELNLSYPYNFLRIDKFSTYIPIGKIKGVINSDSIVMNRNIDNNNNKNLMKLFDYRFKVVVR